MKKLLLISFLVSFLVLPIITLAQEGFSLELTGITFSRDPILEGDLVRVYARVFNKSQDDISGFVVFTNDGRTIGTPQPISLKPDTYDDAFIDWRATAGTHGIQAKIVNTAPPLEPKQTEATAKKEIVVEKDGNHNGVGDVTEAKIAAAPPLSAKLTDNVAQKASGVFSKIGEAVANFAQSNPIKNGIEMITGIVSDKASSLVKATTDKTKNPSNGKREIDYSKQTASLYDSGLGYLKTNQRFIYLGLGALLLALLLYVLFKRKSAPPLE